MDEERVTGGLDRTGTGRARGPERSAEEQAGRLLSGEAWEAFCETLREAGRHILSDQAPGSPRERAEGFRHLAGLVTAGIRQAVQLSDPDFPVFVRNPDSSSKWGAENADNLYLWTRIRSDATYRITGQRGSVHDFLIEVKEGYMQLGDERNFATLTAGEVEIDPDGHLEIRIGGEPHPGNWLPLHPDARYLAIRQYFWDWEHEEPAELRIERIGGEGQAPPPLGPARVARMLDNAGAWVEATAAVWSQWVLALRQQHRPGRIAPARLYVGGADDIRYGNDVYRLADDEAMILETEPPEARYWSFQLVNLWFESLDYARRQTSLNGHQVRVDRDGRIRIVIAHRDPGVPNWLDTAGHREGVIQYRWIWTRTSPMPRARVVPFARIREELPADTPVMSENARRAILAVRQAHVARRERPC